MDKTKDEMDEYQSTGQQLALKFLSFAAKALPRKMFYPLIMKNVDTLMKTGDPLKQEAALRSLAWISEHMSDLMRRDLKTTIMGTYIKAGLTSQNKYP